MDNVIQENNNILLLCVVQNSVHSKLLLSTMHLFFFQIVKYKHVIAHWLQDCLSYFYCFLAFHLISQSTQNS